MYPIYKIQWMMLLLCLGSVTFLQGQKIPMDSNSINGAGNNLDPTYMSFFNIEARSCFDTTSRSSCHCEGMMFYGTVREAFVKIWDVNPDRIQFVGNVPKSKFCFNNHDYGSLVDFKSIFVKLMRQHYRLKRIYEASESCEFWMVDSTREIKLPLYDAQKEGTASVAYIDSLRRQYVFIGMPIEDLALGISLLTGKTVETTILDLERKFTFNIPLESAQSFEALQLYLKKAYGLSLRKEKRMASMLIVEF
jgi:hypothetical protein